jgi:plastocyanin
LVPTVLLGLVVPIVTALAVVATFAFTSAKAGPSAHGTRIEITNFTFTPRTLTVRAGTMITVTNRDATFHTLTARNRAFGTGPLRQGVPVSIRIPAPGTYPYFCMFHPFMTGVIRAT